MPQNLTAAKSDNSGRKTHGTPQISEGHRAYRRGRRRHHACRARRGAGQHRHGHRLDLAARLPGPRHPGPAPGRPDRGANGRRDKGPVLRRRRAGRRLRQLRRGRQRQRPGLYRRRVLLEGQAPRLRGLLHAPLRPDLHRDGRLDQIHGRTGAVGRAVRRVRPEGIRLRQHRRADGRLVQQGDQLGRRPQGPEDAHPGPRRRRHGQARRLAGLIAGRPDLREPGLRRHRKRGCWRGSSGHGRPSPSGFPAPDPGSSAREHRWGSR